MNTSHDNLLSIGSFAGITRLSLKALRLYDRLGILQPRYVDPESSYRYYDAGQVDQARLIRLMREMDMPLADIRQALSLPPDQAIQMALAHVQSLYERAEQARRTVQDLIAYLQGEVKMTSFEVEVRQADAQPIVSITRHTKVDRLNDEIVESLRKLRAHVQAQGGQAAGAPFGFYHGPINNEDDGPIEVCVPVASPIPSSGEICSHTLPAARLAVVTLHDKQCFFPEILKGYDAVYDWIRANGYEQECSPREIWVSRPGEPERMEIAWAFKEKGGRHTL